MMRFLALAALLAAGSASADPVYKSADFTGGLNNVTSSLQGRLTAAGYDASLFGCSTCAVATPVGGNLTFDSAVAVPNTTTPTNVFSIGAPAGAEADEIFQFSVDGIHLQFGDAGVAGGPALQYKNGLFNGVFFAEDFNSPNGTPLELNVQGGTFSLIRLSDRGLLFSGFINTAAGLQNVQDYVTSAVPEPRTYALIIAGILLLAFTGLVRNSYIAPRLSAR
jgi:hypothetical protein